MLNKIDRLAIILTIALSFFVLMEKFDELKINFTNKQITEKIYFQKVIQIDNKKSLIVKSNRYGHYLINGKINGIPVKFAVDTGATTVAVPTDIAKKANLKKIKPVKMCTPAGTAITSSTVIPSLTFGPFHLKNFEGIFVSSELQFVLLGSNALKNFNITQKNGTMIIGH